MSPEVMILEMSLYALYVIFLSSRRLPSFINSLILVGSKPSMHPFILSRALVLLRRPVRRSIQTRRLCISLPSSFGDDWIVSPSIRRDIMYSWSLKRIVGYTCCQTILYRDFRIRVAHDIDLLLGSFMCVTDSD